LRARRSRRSPRRRCAITFGTRWLQAGGDIYKLSKILGHSSVAVTEAHYAHSLK
jgi:integrase